MIRLVRFDLLQRKILNFRCNRVVFSDVNINVPSISCLTDYNFLDEKLKKYTRVGGEEVHLSTHVCSKCEGYGFYDWVTSLRGPDDEDDEYWSDTKELILVKNENPITHLFTDESNPFVDKVHIYYPSSFEPDELTHRCENCYGTGIRTRNLTKYTSEEFIETVKYPERIIEKIIPKNTATTFLGQLWSLITKGGTK